MNIDAASESRRVLPAELEREQREAGAFLRHRHGARIDGHCVTLTDPHSYEAGQYLRLRYCVESIRSPGRGVVVGICSPAAGDGKSFTAVNLAGALAQGQTNRVLIIDTDIRRRSETLRRLLPANGGSARGLSDLLLRGRPNAEEAARRIDHSNLWLLPTGSRSIAPYEAFQSSRFAELLDSARAQFDYVVLDAPPVVAVPDCKLLAERVDGFVMVVSAGITPRVMLAQALEILGPKRLLGLVLNRCDQLPRRYYRYYGHYGYSMPTRRRDPEHMEAPGGEFVPPKRNEGGPESLRRP